MLRMFCSVLAVILVVPGSQSLPRSASVTGRTGTALATLHNHLVSGKATAADYNEAADALDHLFQLWDQNGTTQELEQVVLIHGREFSNPSQAMIFRMYLAEQRAGLDVDQFAFTDRMKLNLTREKVGAMIDAVQLYGVSGLHRNLVSALRSKADEAVHRPRIILAAAFVESFCTLLSILAVYEAVIGLMLLFGVITAPLDIPLGIAGGIEAVIGLIVC
jgi:hypothetical protein